MIEKFLRGSNELYKMIDYCQKNLRNPGIGSKRFRLDMVKILVKIVNEKRVNSE